MNRSLTERRRAGAAVAYFRQKRSLSMGRHGKWKKMLLRICLCGVLVCGLAPGCQNFTPTTGVAVVQGFGPYGYFPLTVLQVAYWMDSASLVRIANRVQDELDIDLSAIMNRQDEISGDVAALEQWHQDLADELQSVFDELLAADADIEAQIAAQQIVDEGIQSALDAQQETIDRLLGADEDLLDELASLRDDQVAGQASLQAQITANVARLDALEAAQADFEQQLADITTQLGDLSPDVAEALAQIAQLFDQLIVLNAQLGALDSSNSAAHDSFQAQINAILEILADHERRLEDLEAQHPHPDPDDTDGDGVPDSSDNCKFVPNPSQADADGDGVGNLCDNCPIHPNPNQHDSDGDGVGNVCDNPPPSDCHNDPLLGQPCDGADVDSCASGIWQCNASNELFCTDDAAKDDADYDGVPDCVDPCPNDPNDMCVDPCASDIDGDGVGDCDDICSEMAGDTITAGVPDLGLNGFEGAVVSADSEFVTLSLFTGNIGWNGMIVSSMNPRDTSVALVVNWDTEHSLDQVHLLGGRAICAIRTEADRSLFRSPWCEPEDAIVVSDLNGLLSIEWIVPRAIYDAAVANGDKWTLVVFHRKSGQLCPFGGADFFFPGGIPLPLGG